MIEVSSTCYHRSHFFKINQRCNSGCLVMDEKVWCLDYVWSWFSLWVLLTYTVIIHHFLFSLQLYRLSYWNVVHHILTLIDVPEYTSLRTHWGKGWIPRGMMWTLTMSRLLRRHDYLHPVQNVPQLCLHMLILDRYCQRVLAFHSLVSVRNLRKT